MDLFESIRKFDSVKKVSNFYLNNNDEINFLFFICPKPTGKSIFVNEMKTGLECGYVDSETNNGALINLKLVQDFISEFNKLGVPFTVNGIFAAADSFILYPIPVNPPSMPKVFPFELVTNYNVMKDNILQWSELYYDQPWKKFKESLFIEEANHLRSMLEFKNLPKNLIDDFIRRCFAGYVLDGIVIRKGYFGMNPIILGVEMESVSFLHNVMLDKDSRLPIIQLK